MSHFGSLASNFGVCVGFADLKVAVPGFRLSLVHNTSFLATIPSSHNQPSVEASAAERRMPCSLLMPAPTHIRSRLFLR